MVTNLTDIQIEIWRDLVTEASSDATWSTYHHERDIKGKEALAQIVALLNSFISAYGMRRTMIAGLGQVIPNFLKLKKS
jgi:hypothetical protein